MQKKWNLTQYRAFSSAPGADDRTFLVGFNDILSPNQSPVHSTHRPNTPVETCKRRQTWFQCSNHRRHTLRKLYSRSKTYASCTVHKIHPPHNRTDNGIHMPGRILEFSKFQEEAPYAKNSNAEATPEEAQQKAFFLRQVFLILSSFFIVSLP